jgi:hypothetical protein
MCLPFGFAGLPSVAVLNVLVGAGVCCMAVGHHRRSSLSYLQKKSG